MDIILTITDFYKRVNNIKAKDSIKAKVRVRMVGKATPVVGTPESVAGLIVLGVEVAVAVALAVKVGVAGGARVLAGANVAAGVTILPEGEEEKAS